MSSGSEHPSPPLVTSQPLPAVQRRCCQCGRMHTVPLSFPAPAVFGKVEGTGEKWHGHVTAVTVAPPYRRLRLAEKLIGLLEVGGWGLADSSCCAVERALAQQSAVQRSRGAVPAGTAAAPQLNLALLALLPALHCSAGCDRQAAPRLFCGPFCARVQRGGHQHVHQGKQAPPR